MTDRDPPEQRAWNSTLKRGKGLRAKPSWKGYGRGNSLASSDPPASKVAPRRTRIRPVSARTAARNREYTKVRAAAKAASPWCVFPFDDGSLCGKPMEENHHREPTGIAPDRFLDPTNFVSLCVEHHQLITRQPLIGYENGLLERSAYELRRQQADHPEGDLDGQ